MKGLLLPGIGRDLGVPCDKAREDPGTEPRSKGSLYSTRSRISTMADTPLTDGSATRQPEAGGNERPVFEEGEMGGKKLSQDDFEVVGSLGYGG
ncbi:hypothetical protein FOZ63_020662, partial [Perkinsus olseni]|uniref:Uncharacterized protein n=1 Tax=Perkinsus olseni TaxID=32597 RepID=A0A7J6QJV6_PEROL